IQAHLVSRHGLTTASLQLVSSTLSRLCLMARPKRRATKFIPNRTTLHHPPVVAPISVVDHCLPYEKHNLYDVTFNNTILRDHHHRVLTDENQKPKEEEKATVLCMCVTSHQGRLIATIKFEVVDVLRDTKQKRHPDGYEDGNTTLRKVSSAANFIWSCVGGGFKLEKLFHQFKSLIFTLSLFLINTGDLIFTPKIAKKKVLVYYYPLAGRLRSVDDHTHKLEVDCNGEGAVFAEAFMARVLVYYSSSHNTEVYSTMLYSDEMEMRLNKVSELIHNSTNHQNLDSAGVSVHFQEIVDLDDGTYEAVARSDFVITRVAFRDNSSKYYINDRTSNFTEVTKKLKGKGVDLDNNRFLILQGEVEQISLMKPKAQGPHDEVETEKYRSELAKVRAELEPWEKDLIEHNGKLEVACTVAKLLNDKVLSQAFEDAQKQTEIISETIKSKTASICQINSDIEKRKHEGIYGHMGDLGAIDETLPFNIGFNLRTDVESSHSTSVELHNRCRKVALQRRSSNRYTDDDSHETSKRARTYFSSRVQSDDDLDGMHQTGNDQDDDKFDDEAAEMHQVQGTLQEWVIRDETTYRNFHKLTLQEGPGIVPAGRVPRNKEVILVNDLIDYARIGKKLYVEKTEHKTVYASGKGASVMGPTDAVHKDLVITVDKHQGDLHNTLIQNLKDSDPIISRFDIVCVVKDVVEPNTAEMLATFVVDNHFKSQDVHILPQELPKKYITYAKLNISPRLDDLKMVKDELSETYAELQRKSSYGQGVHIAIRHLESMIRMSEAHARMHLKQHVTQENADMAIRVLL
ncbi:Histone-lysine N-methyltransferase TRX1 isoform F, partial [Glycine soja]